MKIKKIGNHQSTLFKRKRMKKIVMSAVALTAIMGSINTVSAAEKGIEFTTSGQTVLYYNTATTKASDLLNKSSANTKAKANFGIQLNLNADLGNDFAFGSTINYLGTLGLEKNVVNGTMQNTNGGIAENNIADDIYLSQLYVAKQIANTTIKLGRQELPKSLSPFAFSEGWNVFKNTFDAGLVVNSDLPDTLIVGAYVAKGNGNGFGNNMSSFTDLVVQADAATTEVGSTAYMLTVQNKSLPMTTLTGSYYHLSDVDGKTTVDLLPNFAVSADVFWLDAKIADKSLPAGLNFGLQAGQISPDSTAGVFDDTAAFGLKVAATPVENLSLIGAFTSVDGNNNKANVAIKNTTGVKTPLYTQMIANQNAIALDADTFMLKAVYGIEGVGKVIAQGSQTSAGKSNLNAADKDFTDLELIFKTKVSKVDLLVAGLLLKTENATRVKVARIVARYNF